MVWSTEYGFWSETDASSILTLPIYNCEESDFVQFFNVVSFSWLICKLGLASPDKEDMRMK